MRPDAEVRLPAETVYVAVLRMAASGIAARLDFTLDEVEDLRMAVSEACALVLADATPGGDLTAGFFLGEGSVRITVSADSSGSGPDQDSFAWQVLTTTADDVVSENTGGQVSISLTVTSATAGPTA
ncbi:MAG: anti-sigma factor [Marmoricola sp.]